MASISPVLLDRHGAGGRRSTRGGWLFGPAIDLLFGYGAAYLLTVPVLLALGLVVSGWPRWLAFSLLLAFNTPHYGATLLRVYEERRDRQKYAVFALHFTALISVAFAVGLYEPWMGSLLLTVYVTWSPWHFAGQNYGLALMSLRRRGVEITPLFKRLLYASFGLSFVLATLSIHGENSSVVFAQNAADAGDTYHLIRVGIPRSVVSALALGVGAAYLGCLAGAVFELWRRATPSDLLPTALLVLTQALWFAVPALGATVASHPLHGLAFSAIWISSAHSLQYLWVTAYYAKNSEAPTRTVPFLGKAMLAGCALTLFPLYIFVPGLLGSLIPANSSVYVLLFAVVNVHHFVLDGAIWKLRDGRVAQVLLRSGGAATPAATAGIAGQRRWGRHLVWAAGLFSLFVIPAYHWWEVSVGASSVDLHRVEGVARRLGWFGRDSSPVLANLGNLYESSGRIDNAVETFRRLAELDRENAFVEHRVAALLVKHRGSDPASLREATFRARRASSRLQHQNLEVLYTLTAALAAEGRTQEARRTARFTLDLARKRGNAAFEEKLHRRFADLL